MIIESLMGRLAGCNHLLGTSSLIANLTLKWKEGRAVCHILDITDLLLAL